MLKILIVSDLHAFTPREGKQDSDAPSFLVNSEIPGKKLPNPLELIPQVLKDEGLAVDWILCPGDIADRADPDSQSFAWRHLAKLKTALKSRLLLGTAGNHDIDSRLVFSEFDPKGHLQSLTPPFPGDNEASDRYWARNFHIHEEPKASVRLLNLNSAAFHGFSSQAKDAKPEYLHGRVSERTIDAIKEDLSARKPFDHNILFTHHHPFRNDDIYASDYSNMELGGRLVAGLCEATNSDWLIIHGHQHYPALRYAPGGTFQSVIFSAGSVSATLKSPMAAEAPNQFYHLTLEPTGPNTKNWRPCGLVRAWHWTRGRQWDQSPSGFNIPYESGFGCRENVANIVTEIAATVLASGADVVEMTDVLNKHPYLQFVIKPTIDQIIKELPNHGVRCVQAVRLRDSNFRRA